MIILRSKIFAIPTPQVNQDLQNKITKDQQETQSQEVTSRDLQVEQMKQQRQLIQTQRMQQRLQAQERQDRVRQLQESQKDKQEEKTDQSKNQIQAKKSEQLDGAKNVGLYKTKAKTVAPVPMGK